MAWTTTAPSGVTWGNLVERNTGNTWNHFRMYTQCQSARLGNTWYLRMRVKFTNEGQNGDYYPPDPVYFAPDYTQITKGSQGSWSSYYYRTATGNTTSVTCGCTHYSSYIGTGYLSWTQTVPAVVTYALSYANGGHGTAPGGQSKYKDVAINLQPFISQQYGTNSTVTITGNANGGTWNGSNGNAVWHYVYDQTGWQTGSTTYGSQASYTANSTATFTAVWSSYGAGVSYTIPSGTPQKNSTSVNYTITFNANGGTTTKSSEISSIITDYPFKGWFTSSTGGTQRTTNSRVTAAETVYAQFNTVTNPQTAVTLPSIAECTRTNYALLGFSTSSGATSADYQPGSMYTPPAADTILYAVWTTYVTGLKTGEIAQAAQYNTLRNALLTAYNNRTLSVDGRTLSSLTSSIGTEKVTGNNIADVSILNSFLVINDWPNVITQQNYENILKDGTSNDIIPGFTNAKRDATGTSSAHDCRGACVGICHTSCAGGAQGNGGNNGNGSGANWAACSGNCSGACIGCSGGCYGSCTNGCTGSCSGNCANSCTGKCSTSCSGCSGCTGCKGCSGCTGRCSGCGTCSGRQCAGGASGGTRCNSGCAYGCYGCSGSCEGCSGKCGNTCKSACGTGCSGACGSTCSGACGSGCTASCGGGCSSGCGSGCTTSCGQNCTGACSAVCSGGCQNGCNGCNTVCGSSCNKACSIGCQTTCTSGCATECTAGCYGTTTGGVYT